MPRRDPGPNHPARKKGSEPMRYSQTPEPSEGVDFIIERAMAGEAGSPEPGGP
jgi:hypothetical protein